MTKNKYKIIYSPLFYNDLANITDYILNTLNNKKFVTKLIDDIEFQILKRSIAPESYQKYISIKNRKSSYYKINVKKYIVFYTVNNDTMVIRRILYSKRDFNKFI